MPIKDDLLDEELDIGPQIVVNQHKKKRKEKKKPAQEAADPTDQAPAVTTSSGPTVAAAAPSIIPIPASTAASEKPVFKFVPKKERERLAAEKEAKEAEEKRKKQEEATERARQWREEFVAQADGYYDDRHHYDRNRRHDGYDRHNGGGGANGRKRGRDDDGDHKFSSSNSNNKKNGGGGGQDKRSAQEQAEYERLRERYLGPDRTKSTFTAKKKRRRGGQEFKFDWDPEEDTRNLADEEARLAGEKQFRPLLTSNKMLNISSREEEYELAALKSAHYARLNDRENGQERAKQIMDEYYRAREVRNKPLRNMKHWSEKPLDEMRERDWRIFKEDFGIATKGGAIPNPMRSWRESTLPPRLLDVVERVGYHEPTPIQRAAIPIALQGRDLIGVAVTGSGKTAAFLLPLLVYIKELPPLDEVTKNDGPYALILAPTRELAQQIESEARKFATPFGYTVVSIVGGHSLEEQAFALRNGAEIVVATPGRLVDCIERRLLVLSQCCYVIMDEADRMIDLGFEDPLNKILDAMPTANEKPDTDEAENAQAMTRYLGGAAEGSKIRYRETMMYTATMPTVVERIAKRYLRRPATVTIGNAGEAVDTVEQRVEFVAGEDRRKKRLQEILQSGTFTPPIIVFVNIKRNCEMVARDVRSMGFSTVTLHGSKTQEQREAALATLRQGKADVLVATDLAGRGIDVADVSLVVNFNMATSIEQYTHRIGRTGRAGKSGVAITFLGNEDTDVLYDLRQMISKSSISKVSEELRRHEASQQKPTKANKGGGESGGKGGHWNN